MKLPNQFSFKKFLTNFCVLIALVICGSNALQLRDSGKSIQTANSNEISFNENFLEKKVDKKKSKRKSKTKSTTHKIQTINTNETLNNTPPTANATKKFRTEAGAKSATKWATGTQNTPPVAAGKAPYKNDTFSKSIWRDLNNTMVRQKINVFLANHRKWDFKMLDHQLQDIAMDMNYRDQYGHTQEGLRAFIRFFVNYFEACDKDGDNQLSRKEFQACMKNDTFLMIIDVPSKTFSPLNEKPLNYTDPKIYADVLFDLLDTHETGFMNFHSYMHLRLYIFSWRRCSVAAPFIDETNFECAIEIAAGWKTMNRNTARKLYYLAIEMSGDFEMRYLDFITYVSFAQAVRLYAKINGKEDNDITRSEFNMALDSNLLPVRYNQEVIDNFFKLIEEKDIKNQGIDLLTFCFYDFFLKLFHKQADRRSYFLNRKQFIPIFSSQLIPYYVKLEFTKIPQNNLTSKSYDMYTYFNVSNYQDESDYFLKSFLEKETSEETFEETNSFLSAKSKERLRWSLKEINATNLTFNANQTYKNLFNVVDTDMDGRISYYEFGSIMQIVYLFTRFDRYYKGRIPAGELYEKFRNYYDYPLVSYRIRQRAKIFNRYPQDLYVDLFSAILTMKIDDLFAAKVRREDKSLCTEIELKQVLAWVNRRYVKDAFLNRCLRGTNKDNIPMYDWECAFAQAEISTLTFFENSFDRLTVKKQELNLQNTVFYNIDPSLPQQGTVKGELKNSGYEIKY